MKSIVERIKQSLTSKDISKIDNRRKYSPPEGLFETSAENIVKVLLQQASTPEQASQRLNWYWVRNRHAFTSLRLQVIRKAKLIMSKRVAAAHKKETASSGDATTPSYELAQFAYTTCGNRRLASLTLGGIQKNAPPGSIKSVLAAKAIEELSSVIGPSS